MEGIPDTVARNRSTAYAGEIGRRRLQFCLDYTAYKQETLLRGAKLLREDAAASGESITCQKGCSYCCSLYVFATLQDAECIVYHLYRHESALKHFLSAYQLWRRKVAPIQDKLARIDRLTEKKSAQGLSDYEKNQFYADLNSYAGLGVPCPFLADNCCSVYDVRPFVCGALAAVTPPEMCSLNAASTTGPTYRKLEVKPEKDLPYFLTSRNGVIFSCLPELVNQLLERGYNFLAEIEWTEDLHFPKSLS